MRPLCFKPCVFVSLFVGHVCASVHLLHQTVWFIPLLWCNCLGHSVCYVYAQRSLCNCRKPPKAPFHLEATSIGCLSVHPSIYFNCPESGLGVIMVHRLNILIHNQVWDHTNSLPWCWPDNAGLDWEQAASGAKGSSLAVIPPNIFIAFCIIHYSFAARIKSQFTIYFLIIMLRH